MVYMRDGGHQFEANEPASKARLLLEDATGVVFIDLDECADDNSLASIVEDLQHRVQWNLVNRGIILTIQAQPKHPAMHHYLMRSGAFMVGLRALCLPILAVVSGRVAGPAWSLLLGCDFRYGVIGTSFHLP